MKRVFTQKYVPHHCHGVMETAKMFFNDASRSTNDAFILILLDQFQSNFLNLYTLFFYDFPFFVAWKKYNQ